MTYFESRFGQVGNQLGNAIRVRGGRASAIHRLLEARGGD
jgi:hypothetical protein